MRWYSAYEDKSQAQLMTLLKEKLAESQWKEADRLTQALMLKISSLKYGNYLCVDIDNCPDKEIKEIDQLWLDRSSDFGFSTQKDIYNRGNYQQFITNVGWYKGDSWLSYDDLFYWEGNGPKGHLPYCGSHFWLAVFTFSTSSHLSNDSHFHQPHYHHAPHGHNSGGDALGAAAGLGAAALAFGPLLIGAAALGGAAYLIHQEVTKDERKRKERLEKEEAERQQRQKRLEWENKVEKNIGTLLALV